MLFIGPALGTSNRLLTSGCLCTFVVLLTACGDSKTFEPGTGAPGAAPNSSQALPASNPIFIDAGPEVGLDFEHFNGMIGERYMFEIMGPGAAFFDYDNDGDLDLYLVQGREVGSPDQMTQALFAPQGEGEYRDRLWRNDLTQGEDGRPDLRFVDVTEASGLQSTGYGMGVAAADIDNDGWVDLYVTNHGPNRLLRNRGPGENGAVTFEDITEGAGVGDPGWGVSAAFVDLDRDGWLDLYVGNYVVLSAFDHRTCRAENGTVDYCGPLAFRPQADRLYRNLGGSSPAHGFRGDVIFEDASAGPVADDSGGSLGVVTADFNSDGWSDLYVANDGRPNLLWTNGGDGSLHNEAVLAGCSVNERGVAEASMGGAAADVDGDGDEDLFLSHLTGETNTLYLNDGQGLFQDVTVRTGLGSPSLRMTGFGTGFFDYDNDGWLDVLVVNGAVRNIDELASSGDSFPLHQPNQLFRNLGKGDGGADRFLEVTEDAGEVFELSEVSRGAAFGDVDNDGDTDVVVMNNNGPTRLLINQVGQDKTWLGLRLVDASGRSDRLGTLVEVELSNGRSLWRRVRTDGSYASASDPRLLFGLGDAVSVAVVRVHWPSGDVESWLNLALDRYHVLREGTSSAAP